MLNNIKISTRLTFLLVLLLAVVMAVGGASLYTSGKSNAAMKSVYHDRVVPIMNLNMMHSAILSIRLAVSNGISLADNPKVYIQEILDNKVSVDVQWQQFAAIVLSDALVDDEDRMLAKNFTNARDLFFDKGVTPAVAALNAHNLIEAKRLQVEDISRLSGPLNDALDALIEMQKRDSKSANEKTDEAYNAMRMYSIALALIGVMLGAGLGYSIIRGIDQSVNELHGVMVKISSDGNLNSRAVVYGQEEIGQASTAFNALIERFSNIMREIDDCSRNIGQSSYQVATISNEISEVSTQQESHSGEVISAMQQLHQISSTVQVQAAAAAERSRQVEHLALEGIQNVNQNIGSMEATTREVSVASVEIRELEQSAQQIHNIVKTIKEIAGQTNLLALNAAIEAARAGEQGRGFAVVADEVRKLAERTTHSATEVSDIIGVLSAKVNRVAATMGVVVQSVNLTQQEAGKTARTIESMSSNAVETAQANQAISGASQQQLEQFKLLQTTLEDLFLILKESGAKVEMTAAIGDDLRALADRLKGIMSGFAFNSGTVIQEAQHEKRRVPRAQHGLLVKLAQNGQTIGGVTSDFSLTGMRLRVPQPVNEQGPVELSIYLPNDDLASYERQEALQIAGRIQWQRKDDKGYSCGIEFVNADDSDRIMIKKCFEFFSKNAEF
ncbi:MAG: methyl-accepting chemotaxis protein [Gallionella sp.]